MWAGIAILVSGCGYASYAVRRTVLDSPVNLDSAAALEPGTTTFAQAVERLGPPDAITRGRNLTGDFVVRADWLYRKGRSSGLRLSVPERSVLTYNGLGYFLLFLQGLRPGSATSVVPGSVRDVDGESGFPPTSTSAPRLRNVRESAGATSSGRARRLDDVRLVAGSPTPRGGGKDEGAFAEEEDTDSGFRPLSVLAVDTADAGTDRIRLEFDADGILVQRSVQSGVPETDFQGQVFDSVIP